MGVGVSFFGMLVILFFAALIIVPAIVIPIVVTRNRNRNNIPQAPVYEAPVQPMPQMVCGNCGQPLQQGSTFCANCGVRVVE